MHCELGRAGKRADREGSDVVEGSVGEGRGKKNYTYSKRFTLSMLSAHAFITRLRRV